MIVIVDSWQPLGAGRIAPQGSIADHALASRLAQYKRSVAGAYRAVSPRDIETVIPPGMHLVSEKVDGECWFLHVRDGEAILLSPTGKAVTDIPLTIESARLLNRWNGIIAGELYATVDGDRRPHVFDLHAALGGGVNAQVERLSFAAFDLLQDGGENGQLLPFAGRIDRLQEILGAEKDIHLACHELVDGQAGVKDAFEKVVTHGGAEGIVVHCADGRTLKIKPEITVDAAVVGFGADTDNRITELLLALMKPDGIFQLIGRARTGFSEAERRDLNQRLASQTCSSAYRKTCNGGLYHWVRPELVVEVKCNDLISENSAGVPKRRMALQYSEERGWQPLGPMASVSMINAVYQRIREDKSINDHDIRFSQVTDLVPVADDTAAPTELPESTVIRREVYTKPSKTGTSLRKLTVWRTNKHDLDAGYPPFVAFFTDYAPGRNEPLQTGLRVASNAERLNTIADDWLALNIKRGWEQVSAFSEIETTSSNDSTVPVSDAPPDLHRLTIAISRSNSPSFPIVRRRLDTLAQFGGLEINRDEKGREAWFELTMDHSLVENARRIANLLKVVRAWKSTEISLDGEPLDKRDADSFLNRLDDTRRCWAQRKARWPQSCRDSCALGCGQLSILATKERLRYSPISQPAWYAVGSFDGERVQIDKHSLREQIDHERNTGPRLCPHFDDDAVRSKIDSLPDSIAPENEDWALLYNRDDRSPVWVWPNAVQPPVGHTFDAEYQSERGLEVRVGIDLSSEQARLQLSERRLPSTRFADVCGQESAVEAVRDAVMLPLLHAELFQQLGSDAPVGGVLLAGPPGTGKTLLARAVAGEADAHIEIVSGPELLSKWIGVTEEGLRAIFARAQALQPSVVLFDELDSIAPVRGGHSGDHGSIVAQLLALLDGIEDRGRVFVIGTTNRPGEIDPALRRPGRFDRVIEMGPPDQVGRETIFAHHLKGLRLDDALDREQLARELATATSSLTGADIANICRQAVTNCVKAAVASEANAEHLTICREHFVAAIPPQLPSLPGLKVVPEVGDVDLQPASRIVQISS